MGPLVDLLVDPLEGVVDPLDLGGALPGLEVCLGSEVGLFVVVKVLLRKSPVRLPLLLLLQLRLLIRLTG